MMTSQLHNFVQHKLRMDEHVHVPMLSTSMLTIIISLCLLLSTLPQSHGQLPPPEQSPLNYSICREQSYSYSCGNLSNIFYSFWGGNNRPEYCGGGDLFQLHCHGGQNTTILIGSQEFTVMDIDPEKYTMRLKRSDLAQDVCSQQFDEDASQYFNGSGDLFSYGPKVYKLTISYGCTPGSDYFSNRKFRYSFSCGDEDVFYSVGDLGLACQRHTMVPTDTPLTSYTSGESNTITAVIDAGFEVEYTVNEDCGRCLGGTRSDHGDCWNSGDDAVIEQHIQRSCYYSYCPDGSATTTQCSAHHKTPPTAIAGKQFTWKRKTILGVMSAVSAALLMCFIFCCLRCKPSKRVVKFWLMTKNEQDIETFLKNHGALSQKRYKFSEVKKMTNSFKVKLGQGGFGAVYKGKMPNGCHVAVKILNASKGNGEEFINEVASISRTSHVNVVNLVGFCFEARKKALIYEFMPNGSLDKFIYNKGPETIASLSWENLYKIAKEIARGLEYLHRGCNTQILHFDIKPHNILLDENFSPKISDFGLAKLCLRKESSVSMSDARGTMGYVAPEVWNRHFGGVSHKSDVYSYGMMLLEMVGARKNINAEASHTSEIYFPHWMYSRLELGLRPDVVMARQENEIARRMTIVGLWCIQTLPNDRHAMSRVIDMLEGNMDSLEIPPKPLLSSPTRSVSESSTS